MSYTVAEVSDFERRVTLLLESEPLDRAETRAARRLARDIHINGFRRGRAPRRMVERVVGRQRVRNDAIEDLLTDRLPGVWEGSGLAPAVSPVVNDIREVDGGVEVDLLVSLWPSLPMPPFYEGRRIELEATADIDEQEVERYLDHYREQFAELETVERPAGQGDYVAIDLVSSHEGRPLEAPAVTGFLYELGADSPIEGMTGQLLGCRAGDVAEFLAPLPFPTDELEEGTEIEVRVTVEEVREKLLPDLDDEWVSDFTDFERVSELREDIRSDLEEGRIESLQGRLRDTLLTELAREVALDVPAAVVDSVAMQMLGRMRQRLEGAGSNLDEYLEATGRDAEAIFGELRARAKSQIEVGALLDSVAEHAGIEVGDDELLDGYRKAAPAMEMSPEDLVEAAAGSVLETEVRSDILRTKAMDALMKSVVATDGDGALIDLQFDTPEPAEVVEAEVEW